jgi:hypothetical protein
VTLLDHIEQPKQGYFQASDAVEVFAIEVQHKRICAANRLQNSKIIETFYCDEAYFVSLSSAELAQACNMNGINPSDANGIAINGGSSGAITEFRRSHPLF